MDENQNNQNKPGVSVKEIEAFARKHRFEVVFCLSFIFACFFSFVFFGAGAAVLFGAIGGILGVLFPSKIEHFGRTIFNFVFKQEQTTQIVLAVVWVVLSIFLPPLVFLFLGLHGGKSIQHMAMELYSHYLK